MCYYEFTVLTTMVKLAADHVLPHAPLSSGVLQVVSLRTNEKMFWPDAERHIAVMTDVQTSWNRANVQFIRYSMRAEGSTFGVSRTVTHHPISIGVSLPCPEPTSSLRDSRPCPKVRGERVRHSPMMIPNKPPVLSFPDNRRDLAASAFTIHRPTIAQFDGHERSTDNS
jgi:hypothetical protein